MRGAPPVVARRSRGPRPARCAALQLGLIRPCHPPWAVVMPADWKPPACAPLRQRRVRDASHPLHVRHPPRVVTERRTAPSAGVMHAEAPPHLHHRRHKSRHPAGDGRRSCVHVLPCSQDQPAQGKPQLGRKAAQDRRRRQGRDGVVLRPPSRKLPARRLDTPLRPRYLPCRLPDSPMTQAGQWPAPGRS